MTWSVTVNAFRASWAEGVDRSSRHRRRLATRRPPLAGPLPAASVHRSLPEKAGTARSNYRLKAGRFWRRIRGYSSRHSGRPLLLAWGKGDEAALERLVPIVHG